MPAGPTRRPGVKVRKEPGIHPALLLLNGGSWLNIRLDRLLPDAFAPIYDPGAPELNLATEGGRISNISSKAGRVSRAL